MLNADGLYGNLESVGKMSETLDRLEGELLQYRVDELLLQELTEASKRGYLPAGLIVPLYAALGDKDRAFQWLATAVEKRDFDVVWLKIDPLFDLIRSDPRFAQVLRGVNLAQ